MPNKSAVVPLHVQMFTLPGRGLIVEEDEELLKIGEQRGFPDFLKIWEKYRKELYGICLKILNGCREDAEDV
ncbi:MAG: hypothetical protein GTO45_41610, partial [Candidatus Aminicenantes bacterium]|nr:hypothetical protein [Candidatus Aminicenantes bacterium]NIM85110.1 hypothetical protein [Candidatus Aminicenantes bacterium]NIN24620.1 hypothetical protein [Candidatus Aminicenantes bacterium]NIN48381.1 hypothetical protein [Candidatus Aminicenantes bacterium]NIN91284.1 hypothetical protein [Candidatus Aminicenantes bacterium]